MVVSFLVTCAASGANLSGTLIVERMGRSIVIPFEGGKVDVALNGLGTFKGSIPYEIWVPGYVPKQDFMIGVYPRIIEAKMSRIEGVPGLLDPSSCNVYRN